MAGRAVFLGLLLICVASDAVNNSSQMREPSCQNFELPACPLNLVPVCSSENMTYPNECALCAHIQDVQREIFIIKDGSC
ncbi:probable pancreatic secretory proteinase inhibitor [Brachionichthys hirsutus]|uniref:probable pancreatic secretory proteinase inhibitor n=1 Tax=Brachionichthys hirsutus TaxID=412623 RepID=UPI0036045CDC